MKRVRSFNAPFPLIEFGRGTLRVLDGERCREFPFERRGDGRLEEGSREGLVTALIEFLGTRWGPRRRAVCAIGARGVSLRRLRLPSSGKSLDEMLALQVERELPLPPSEIAWGYRRIDTFAAPGKASGEEDLILAAVRRDLVQEYATILDACRLAPVFTPGILSLTSLCTSPPPSYAVLDIGRCQSEFLDCRDGGAYSLRVLQFGGENITAAIACALGVPGDEAERLKLEWSAGLLEDSPRTATIERAIQSAFGELTSLVAAVWSGDRIFLAGKTAMIEEASRWISEGCGDRTVCEAIEKEGVEGSSATLEALKIATGGGRREPSPLLRARGKRPGQSESAAAGLRRWGAIVAGLALVALSFRYSEPLLRTAALEQGLAGVNMENAGGPDVNYELAFLQHIEAQRTPYLIVLDALGEAAPQGARFESLSINRRGEVSFQATLRGSQQTIDLRSRLIASGVFSSVVVEEQRPSPQDRNSLIVRITARCKPAAETRTVTAEASR